MKQLVQLQKNVEEIEDADIQLVGVSYDSVEILHAFAEKREITFPLLSDPESEMITAWGVLNEKARGGQEGVPNPSTIVVDQSGTVRALLEGSVVRRHSTEALLEAAKEIEPISETDVEKDEQPKESDDKTNSL